nr:BUD13 homolog [Euglena gracilis]
MANNMAELLAKYGEKRKKKVKLKPGGSGIRIVDHDAAVRHGAMGQEDDPDQPDDDEPVVVNLDEFNAEEKQQREEQNRRERTERYRMGWQEVGQLLKKEEPLSEEEPDERCPLPERRLKATTDLSPPRRRRHDTPSPAREADLPPPHKGRPDGAASRADLSPPRRRRHDTPPPENRAEDHSPPRRRRHDTPSPQRGADLSPPRKRPAPPPASHTGKGNADLSLPAGAGTTPPPRERNNGDLSPPRKRRRDPDPSPAGHRGAKLLTAEEMRKEQEAAAQAQAPAPPDDEFSGRHAKTIHRRGGKRYDPKDDPDAEASAKQKKVYQPTEQQMEWGMGLVQKKQTDQERDDIIASLKSKFGRDQDDEELDSRLRAVQHWDDPMRNMRDQDDAPEDPLLGVQKLSKKERRAKDKAWIAKEISRRLRFQGSFQPNRFGIYPGSRWDGVDRSTGYEKSLFLAKARAAEEKQRNFASEVEGI